MIGRLSGQRGHILDQLVDLNEDQLRRPLLPSGWTRSDAIIARMELDDPPRQPEQWWAETGLSFPSLRAVLVHVIVETDTHAGHRDVVRELLDGERYLTL